MLRCDRADDIAVLTLDRPGAGNSISSGLTGVLLEELERLAGDETVHAVIITGAGERFFCTGGDVKEYRLIETEEELNARFDRTRRAMDMLEGLHCPVIAAINGYALGGGAEIILCCDYRIAEEHARIGWPQVRLGIIPAWNGIDRLVRDCGPRVASRMMLTGEQVSAAEARELAIIDQVVPRGAGLAAARAWAADLRAGAPLALRVTKRVIRSTDGLERVRELQKRLFPALWFSQDHKEAEAAFAERRAPDFTGR